MFYTQRLLTDLFIEATTGLQVFIEKPSGRKSDVTDLAVKNARISFLKTW